jgi:hypothetical protein
MPTTKGITKRPEFDKHGNYTGYDYFECDDCGFEAMHLDVVKKHDCPEDR